MNLPVWNDATVRLYRGRWNALNKTTAPSSNAGSESDAEAEAELEPDGSPSTSDLGLSPEDILAEGRIRRPLTYDTLYEGLSHLLYTQPGNPPPERLIRHLDGEKNRRALYQEVTFEKKRGGTRTLAIPHHPLRWLQRSLLTVLTHLFPRHRCAHGFERGKSIITHAKQHVGKSYVYTIDIKDFFPSITRSRVYGMLQAYPVNATQQVARYLANLTCYKGRLPQGAPTSPILSNLLCRRLDSRLFKWARNNGYAYSRYADDLTFSTNREAFPDEHQAFIDKIIGEEGFAVNEDKRRLMPYYKRQMVTGLIVNEKVNLPREKLRGLRALLRNIDKFGWESQVGRTSLFDDADEWRAYITGRLDLEGFLLIDRRQRINHELVNPAAQLPGVDSVDALRDVVRGKIAFVGAVRGQDDSIYRRMLAKYERLRERLELHADRREKGRRLFRKRSEEREEPAPQTSLDDAPKYYRQFQEWHRRLRKGDLSIHELRERLSTWERHCLEIGWLLRRNLDDDGLLWEARRVAHALDTSPAETARFFREFDEDEGFRGLLHDPVGISVDPAQIVGACSEALDSYTLPNGIARRAQEVLRRCESWIEAHPGHYPWEGLEEELLREFKQATHFKLKEGEDLIDRLKDHSAELQEKHGVTIELPRRGKPFRTYVPSVLPALKQLLQSMAEHTKSEAICVDVERNDPVGSGMPEAVVKIWDEGGRVDDAPSLDALFTGDTRRALYSQTNSQGLRGYARWTFVAPFADGNAYAFDVMSNRRSKAHPDALPGVMHRVTFYQ